MELEAFDIAALIQREFFRLLREANNSETELVLTSLVGSFARSNAMVDYKCYLIRQFSEQLKMWHARQLLDTLDIRVTAKNKNNILVLNLNVVKTACLLIEVLHVVGSRFNSLQVRCIQIRKSIIAVVH